jgi:hypothetical protein
MDFIEIMTIMMLVISGGIIFLGIPITIILLKDRLSFWPRQKWRIKVYEAEVKDIPTGQVEPLIGADGKPVIDTQGRPVMNDITEKRIVCSEKPVVDGWCWRIKQKIIPWVWVDRGMLRGFKLDITYLAYAAPNSETGEKVIRVAQLSKDVWDGGSFYPLGEPDIFMLDKRHAIFTHKIDQETINQSISAMEATAWTDFQKNRVRGEDDGALMKFLQVAAPIFVVIIVLAVSIFAFDFASKSMDKSIGFVDGHLKTCEAGYMIQTMPAPVANTTTSTMPKLPFG